MAESAVPDEELVGRYLAGDEDAARTLVGRLFAALRPRLRPRMGPALRRRVGESDIIQSAFASLLGRLHEFRDAGPGSFRRWVDTVVDRRLVDELRWHGSQKRDPRRERAVGGLSDRSAPTARGPSPSLVAVRNEEAQRLRAALLLLAPDHRSVIALLHDRGLSLADAAIALERSPEAVRKLYARAVERLVEILALEGGR